MNRRRTDHDETQICKVDNLLRNQAQDIERLRSEVAVLEIELESASAYRRMRHRIDMAIVAVVVAGTAVACVVKL